jgi:hypothetical protein
MAVGLSILIVAWFVGMSFFMWLDVTECVEDQDAA